MTHPIGICDQFTTGNMKPTWIIMADLMEYETQTSHKNFSDFGTHIFFILPYIKMKFYFS